MKQNSRQKNLKGFTLAEVLITLVIVGVIAAITIPTIIANAKEHTVSARLKKFYSTLSQASIRAKADGNDWGIWAESASSDQEFGDSAITAEQFSKKYLLPYLNYTKTEINSYNFFIYLTDGSYFSVNKGNCIDFDFDYNEKKKPNVMGRDIFRFLYCPYGETTYTAVGKVGPHKNIYMNTRQKTLETCKTSPVNCSALLMMDGWEFKDDYPFKL